MFATAFLLRAGDAAIETPTKWIAVSVVGLGLLGASGWLGGKLAYHHGVRVAAEVDQVKGYVRT